MKQVREGQIVKFHTPMEDEDPNGLYVVKEVKGDGDDGRVDIVSLDTDVIFPLISTVLIGDLIVIWEP